MDISGGRESDNIEDDRGGSGGGGGRNIMVGGGLGTIAIVIIALLLGKNPMSLLSSMNGGGTEQTQQQAPTNSSPEEDANKHFVSVILAETEDVWGTVFTQMGKTYQRPKLVLFRNQIQGGCGAANSAVGPFYCPADAKVYLDMSFFDELSNRFHASGDFAKAYVIAHEVGHHVQNLLGTSEKVSRLQQQTDEVGGNKLSVKLELQADFYAGVWAKHSTHLKINERDINDALVAASAIGDDKLQQQAQGYVVPDAFTHGTSQQRMYWFKKGWETGDINQGDTFGSDQ